MDVGSPFSAEDDQQMATEEVSDSLKNKVDNFNFEATIAELSAVINSASEMYQQLKKIKFNYLVQLCDLHSRIDFPSIMMEACHKEVLSNVPSAKDIENAKF